MRHKLTHALRRQHGVMLLEALIGLLIFSVGILAMVGMQAAAFSASPDAKTEETLPDAHQPGEVVDVILERGHRRHDIGDTTEFTPRFVFSREERQHLVVRVRLRLSDPGHRVHPGLPAFAVFSAAPAPDLDAGLTAGAP